MLYVNEIGSIVHGIVYKYSGEANKNIGEAFLMVWKFDQDSTRVNYLTQELELLPSYQVSQLCEMSMISFLKIQASCFRSTSLNKFREHKQLQERLGEHFDIQLSFGLHLGWAIEGAIGSYYKFDASYLSPNVNMAARLQSATKYYEVPMIFSG